MSINICFSKFKQELIPIVCLSIIQLWWSFKFPVFERLGIPWNILLSIFAGVSGIFAIMHLFSNAQRYTSFFNLASLDDMPYARLLKKILQIWRIVVFHAGIIFAWYSEWYGPLLIYYLIQYFYCLLILSLLYRAAHRSPPQDSDTLITSEF